MKVSKAGYIATYMDDGLPVSGVLVRRFLRRPVFYASDPNCGWNSQTIYKGDEIDVIVYDGEITTDEKENLMKRRLAEKEAVILKNSQDILKKTPHTTKELLRRRVAEEAINLIETQKEHKS